MKLKEKFDSIDQSKLNADQKDFLSKIEKATKNFTSDNKEVNDKVEGALDKMIATFKEKMPEAIKTKAEKKEPKASAKKATAKPSQTSTQKRTVMSVAKEIRKDGESWADAQKRARAEMKKDKDSATKEVKTEMDKLLAFIKTRKELEGISGTDLKRDSSREAKPRGRRISKDGNVYYENRENRIDRLAPNYPKDAPMLDGGGDVGKKLYYERMNVGKAKYTVNYHDGVKTHKDGSAFYDIAIFKNKKDLQDFISKLSKEGYKERSSFYVKGGMLSPKERYNLEIKGMTGVSVSAIEKYIDENNLNDNDVLNIVVGLGRKQLKGADVSTAMIGKKGNAESKKLIEFVKDNKAMKMELGGNVGGYDLAGNLGGNFNIGQNDGALSGVSGTSYSGLVGETGAMSSGEMFEDGGDLSGFTGTQYSGLVGETGAMSSGEMFAEGGRVYSVGRAYTNDKKHVNHSEEYEVEYIKNHTNPKRHGYGGMKYADGGDFQAGVYAEGGSLENHGIKEGDTFVKTIAGGIQKVKDKDGKIVFINLATGERDSQPPLPFDDGGEVTYFVNKDGIKVRSVAKPDKELSEKEWMEKHSESKEARAYAGGGLITEQKLERRLKFINEDSERIFKNAPKEFLEHPIKNWDSIGTLLSNIEIASNLKDDESNNWKSIKFSGLNSTEKLKRRLKFINEDSERIFKNAPKKFLEHPVKDWDSIGTLLSNIEIASNLKDDESDNWKFNNGGELNAFSMRMVKGTNSKPDEVLTENQEVKFAGGGKVEKRQAYLDTLADKEADIWDKLGAESGGEIRQDKDMLRNYALKMEAMLKKEEVGKGSFDEADYDHFQDMNAHLMNEFLVWNNYYEPEMTVREKKWRTEKFPDSKYRNYVADPNVISISQTRGYVKIVKTGSKQYKVEQVSNSGNYNMFNDTWSLDELEKAEKFAKKIAENNRVEYVGVDTAPYDFVHGKSKNYIVHADIKFVTVKKDGKELKFKGSDVLNGANILKNGGELSESATYYPKRSIVSVELKDGKKIKPSNGYWVLKTPKMSRTQFEEESFEYKKGGKVSFAEKSRAYAGGGEIRVGDKVKVKASGIGEDYAIVEGFDSANEVLTKNDNPNTYLVVRDSEGYAWEIYLKEVVKFPSKTKMNTGGKVSFAEKSKAIAKNFKGKRVEPEYQKEYGKTYDAKEAKEVGDKIAGAQKAKYDAKAEKGAVVKKRVGNPNAGSAMILAKKIRKDGEKWTDALKRANAMIKNK